MASFVRNLYCFLDGRPQRLDARTRPRFVTCSRRYRRNLRPRARISTIFDKKSPFSVNFTARMASFQNPATFTTCHRFKKAQFRALQRFCRRPRRSNRKRKTAIFCPFRSFSLHGPAFVRDEVAQPYDNEVGGGTFHTGTPEASSCANVETKGPACLLASCAFLHGRKSCRVGSEGRPVNLSRPAPCRAE